MEAELEMDDPISANWHAINHRSHFRWVSWDGAADVVQNRFLRNFPECSAGNTEYAVTKSLKSQLRTGGCPSEFA